ncbi:MULTISPECIES: FMN-binding protein [Micromonospora]|uniref:FMN-binding protein n=1 Tax=Micromonospora solifontis TaxID=2487138 RepID=A0ABX9WE48_9ACTN|nr:MULTISPECIES: FMN-binding protein [Micromonospora]NES12288.1 FMN-binding protein [Micromonospora sp. PPF5-17B]NES37860.1 FMN-binding protein [Micromonospora solifontis]NES54229.1 FMN-binding protein [Micromonospora sp. PPF5-6]RNL97867.1 FMN-binding protein [Micromonospora solifontis]
MRRITIWLLSTVAALVLLFSYKTSTMGAGGETSAIASGSDGSAGSSWSGTDDSGTDGSGTGTTGSGPSSGGTSGDNGSGGPSSGSGTATGSVARTRWGPVQVKITVVNGKITDVSTVQVPDGNRRDQEINDYAVPILRQEALVAQSARIDTVSGATVTSDGYRESLQSAIDAAHLR